MANDTSVLVIDGVEYTLIDSGAKRLQNPVTTPDADGTASAFIDSITQDANGNITVTKRNVTSDIPGTAAYANQLSNARGIDGLLFNGSKNVVRYGVCSSNAGDDKVVTLNGTSGFTLETGATVYVKFSNTNTKANPKLNVNGTGATTIAHYGITADATALPLKTGHVYGFVYDGTNYELIGEYDTNTTYNFNGTYNASSNPAATVKTVTNAIEALDVTAITGSASKTITSISETDGKISATYENIGSLNTSVLTAGTLGVARGGTGAGSFTANRVIISNTSGTGALKASDITVDELGYLSGVTSNIQTQIDAISGGGTDHVRYYKSAIVYTGNGATSVNVATTNIVGGKTVSVGDILIDTAGKMGTVSRITNNAADLVLVATAKLKGSLNNKKLTISFGFEIPA